ncbi:chemotaxis response regulator protein-glutamate methylesterase [Leptospira perolatii]|uniref:Protein-glutamate methylesterase/protein-glutamine glutaminase n=1 Tax=Leptospira perolatii TaxID=2023191 RepID=A0A2M9ZHW5_9LEPT|nr:chemotaxis response regulator protein-glutamate methylesterase [Leptospira perolatii]PJZ69485.1 chemotaxis response regulator protein-glutamate methylesterase [Leptospira perolatii]PJZ71657.1 chemotaxis response regulator protein-glutamate methylesterase [Leptospira perolatii]
MQAQFKSATAKRKVSVFVVDDSLVYRNLLRSALTQDPEIEFLGTAIDGKFALPKIAQLKPDIVILDVEMPELDGIQTLAEIKKRFPETKVIMLSALTIEGAKITLKALEMGAIDFVPKPSADGSGVEGVGEALVSLTAKIKELQNHERIISIQETAPPPPKVSGVARKLDNQFRLCAIGISTGGPIALRQLFSGIPYGFEGTIVVAQHMPPLFTNYLAESLSQASNITVKEAEDGEVLKKGVAYIAPGGKQLEVIHDSEGPKAKVFSGPPAELCKPSVNILFHSLARSFPRETIGVIMTGMGEDGYLGLKELRENGAYLLAQNQESCTVYGMPNRPTKEGLINEVLNVEKLAERITQLFQRSGKK